MSDKKLSPTNSAKDLSFEELKDLQSDSSEEGRLVWNNIVWTGVTSEQLQPFFKPRPGKGTKYPPPEYLKTSILVNTWYLLSQDVQDSLTKDEDLVGDNEPTISSNEPSTISSMITEIRSITNEQKVNIGADISAHKEEVKEEVFKSMTAEYLRMKASGGNTTDIDKQLADLKSFVNDLDYVSSKLLGQFPVFQPNSKVKEVESVVLTKPRKGSITIGIPVTDQPLMEKHKRWFICKMVDSLTSFSNKEKWNLADKLAGVPEHVINSRSDYKRGGLYSWWESYHKNNPLDAPISEEASNGYTIAEAVDFLNEFKKWKNENYADMTQNEIYLPNYVKSQVSSAAKKNSMMPVVEKVLSAKGAGKPERKNEGGKQLELLHYISCDNNAAAAVEKLDILHHNTGLVIGNKHDYRMANKSMKNDDDDDNGTAVVHEQLYHVLPFYEFIGITEEVINQNASKGNRIMRYQSKKAVKGQLEQYKQNDEVKLIIEGVKLLADDQLTTAQSVINKGAKEVKRIGDIDVYKTVTSEKTKELLPKSECPGKSCNCKRLGLFNSLCCDVMHVGEKGEAVKATTVWEESSVNAGQVKRITHWNDDDWEKNGQVVTLGCHYYHMIDEFGNVDGEVQTCGRKKEEMTELSPKQLRNRQIRRELILHESYKGGCFVSFDQTKIKAIPGENMAAFSSHHPAELKKLLIGNVLLDTRKFSALSKFDTKCQCYEDLVENLFPEILLTRLLDERYHRLLHRILLMPSLCKEYPWKVVKHNEEEVLKYTGVVPGSFKDMEETEIEFPSVVGVLGMNKTFNSKPIARREMS